MHYKKIVTWIWLLLLLFSCNNREYKNVKTVSYVVKDKHQGRQSEELVWSLKISNAADSTISYKYYRIQGDSISDLYMELMWKAKHDSILFQKILDEPEVERKLKQSKKYGISGDSITIGKYCEEGVIDGDGGLIWTKEYGYIGYAKNAIGSATVEIFFQGKPVKKVRELNNILITDTTGLFGHPLPPAVDF